MSFASPIIGDLCSAKDSEVARFLSESGYVPVRNLIQLSLDAT